MDRELVLSLFPGLDLFGAGFEAEGYSVVQSGDVIWGRDVVDFHVPPGRFDGVIGGPPCQSFSGLANLVRAKDLEPRFGNLIPEFERIVGEAHPSWFLMENVPQAPWPKIPRYQIHSFLLEHSHLDRGDGVGHRQMRLRRFWFGLRCRIPMPGRDDPAPDLRRHIPFALHVLPDREPAVMAGHGGGDPENPKYRHIQSRSTASMAELQGVEFRERTVTGRHTSSFLSDDPAEPQKYALPKLSAQQMLELQGAPEPMAKLVLEHAPLKAEALRRLIGNAVPYEMACALARAVRRATREG